MEFLLLTSDADKLSASQEIVQNQVHRLDGGSQFVFQEYVNESIPLEHRLKIINRLAVAKDNGVIIGWGVEINRILHKESHAFVKLSYRRQGIATKCQQMIDFNWATYAHDYSAAPKFWASFRPH